MHGKQENAENVYRPNIQRYVETVSQYHGQQQLCPILGLVVTLLVCTFQILRLCSSVKLQLKLHNINTKTV